MVRIYHFGPREVEIITGRYKNGRIAVELFSEEEPYAMLSVNFPEVSISPDEFFAKDYSENEGLAKELVKSGLIFRTGRQVETPIGVLPVYRLAD